jgi:hypothetical protein
MYTAGDFIRDMRSYEGSHAEWAFYVAGVTDRCAVRVQCPYGVLESLPKLTSVPPMLGAAGSATSLGLELDGAPEDRSKA